MARCRRCQALLLEQLLPGFLQNDFAGAFGMVDSLPDQLPALSLGFHKVHRQGALAEAQQEAERLRGEVQAKDAKIKDQRRTIAVLNRR